MSSIDPSKATPQAPRVLRAGSRGHARALAASAEGKPPPDEEEDDDEDEEPPSERDPKAAMGEHEPNRAAAEEAHAKAAEAYKASKGSDSAAALMAAEEAGDAAGSAHAAAKATSAALRGVPPAMAGDDAPPSTQRPAAPPLPPPAARVDVGLLARAIAAGGGSAEAQAKIAQALVFGDRMLALFGVETLEAAEGRARAAYADAADAVKLRAGAELAEKLAAKAKVNEAEQALRAEVKAAVTARKYDRAELCDIDPVTDKWTPKAWVREMSPRARAAMFVSKQARRLPNGGQALPDDTATPISAAVDNYCDARGITDPKRRAAIAAAMSAAPAAQETSR